MNIYPQIYYVYFYLRDDFTPYYVGKGKNKRAWRKHENVEVPKDKSKIIVLKNNISELEAFSLERYYIRWFGKKINGGILQNISDGGEGLPALVGELNGMFGKKHLESSKQKMSIAVSKRLKGKSYEERHGKEKANEIKRIRSEKFKSLDRTGKNNSRFDFTEYTFKNVNGEIFVGTRFDFYQKYKLNKSSVCELIKNNISQHKGWVVENHPPFIIQSQSEK